MNTEVHGTLNIGNVYPGLFVVNMTYCVYPCLLQLSIYNTCDVNVVVVVNSKLLTMGCWIVFQRLLRLQDAKQVEAKAAKIKEWVTNKLREVR
jgi:hypothetical protein